MYKVQTNNMIIKKLTKLVYKTCPESKNGFFTADATKKSANKKSIGRRRIEEGKSHSHSGQLVKRTGRISSYVAVSVTSETAEWLLCKSRSNSRIVRSGCSRAGIPPYSSHNVDSQVSR